MPDYIQRRAGLGVENLRKPGVAHMAWMGAKQLWGWPSITVVIFV